VLGTCTRKRFSKLSCLVFEPVIELQPPFLTDLCLLPPLALSSIVILLMSTLVCTIEGRCFLIFAPYLSCLTLPFTMHTLTGYQFVNILYRDNDGSLGVDTDLINDVREQNGGGGEPLIFED